ncbi:HD-10 [Ecytonucleospora hepatopenaei]|uniref:HD-10 n=1 Tax=Ecytonucleospora hepatopenaei TaxID=646526 RepID=A0A1W0E927_9MICR|nr:HD-10 [Ecytonucleospora hepatopenaei]
MKPQTNHNNNFSFDDNEEFYGENDAVRGRNRTDNRQLSILESVASETLKPNRATRIRLGQELNMTPRQVQIWFQNKRAKLKRIKQDMTDKKEKSGVLYYQPEVHQKYSNLAYTGAYASDLYISENKGAKDPYDDYTDIYKKNKNEYAYKYLDTNYIQDSGYPYSSFGINGNNNSMSHFMYDEPETSHLESQKHPFADNIIHGQYEEMTGGYDAQSKYKEHEFNSDHLFNFYDYAPQPYYAHDIQQMNTEYTEDEFTEAIASVNVDEDILIQNNSDLISEKDKDTSILTYNKKKEKNKK